MQVVSLEENDYMKILLIGATGLIGKELLILFLKQESVTELKVLIRRPLALTHEKLIQKIINFDHLDEYREAFNVEHVFCALGTTIKVAGTKEAFKKVDYDYVYNSAKLAKENGAKSFFLVSALGSNPNSPVFYSRVKGEVERDIKKLKFDRFVIFRPSLLLGKRGEKRAGEDIAQNMMRTLNPYLPKVLGKYKAIEASEVAKAMVEMLLNGKSDSPMEIEDVKG